MCAESRIGFRVVSDIQRPSADLVQSFADVPTGNVCDANGRLGAMDYRIKPLDPSWRFAGTAVTISARPVDNLIVYQALKVAQPGDVLVITNEAATSSAIIGELVAGIARNNGIVAIVTDGLVRDLDGLLELGPSRLLSRPLSQRSVERRSRRSEHAHCLRRSARPSWGHRRRRRRWRRGCAQGRRRTGCRRSGQDHRKGT